MDYQISKSLLEVSAFISTSTLLCLLVFSSYTDLMYKKIYNNVTIPCFLVGMALSIFNNFPNGLLNVFFASMVAFGLFFFMFIFDLMGGGDVKLITATGALIGYPLIVEAIFWGIIVGGVYSVFFLIRKGYLVEVIKNLVRFICRLNVWQRNILMRQQNYTKISFGLCFSIGTCIALILN